MFKPMKLSLNTMVLKCIHFNELGEKASGCTAGCKLHAENIAFEMETCMYGLETNYGEMQYSTYNAKQSRKDNCV